MKKLYRILLLSLFPIIGLSGCIDISDEQISELQTMQSEADTLIMGLKKSIETEEFDKIQSFYSDKFYEHITVEKWNQDLKNIKLKLGELKGGGQTIMEIENDLYVLKYNFKYENYDTEETFTLEKVGGKFQIVGHHIKSAAF